MNNLNEENEKEIETKDEKKNFANEENKYDSNQKAPKV